MVTFALLCAAYILSQFFRSFLAIIAPLLRGELGLDNADLGAVSAAWFAAFALAQFPVGWALDTLGPRRTIAGTLVAAIVGSALFAWAGGVAGLILAMVLIGIGCAAVLMGSLFVFGRAFPRERFAMLSSFILGIGAAGNLLAATPLALAVERIGWRSSMLGIGALTAVVALLVLLCLRDPPPASRPAAGGSAGRDLLTILRIRPLWAAMPLAATSYAVVAAERSLWIGPYLTDVHGLASIERGNGVLAMALAMSLGAFAYGPLERWLGGPKPAVLLGSAVTGLLFVGLGLLPGLTVGPAVAILTAIGGFGLTYGILMAHVRLFIPDHLLGRGVTFFNFLFIGGAGLVQMASGAFIEATAVAGRPTASGYDHMHLAFGILLLAATLAYARAPALPDRASDPRNGA